MKKNGGFLGRSFSKREQKMMMATGAFITIFLVVVSFLEYKESAKSSTGTRTTATTTSSPGETIITVVDKDTSFTKQEQPETRMTATTTTSSPEETITTTMNKDTIFAKQKQPEAGMTATTTTTSSPRETITATAIDKDTVFATPKQPETFRAAKCRFGGRSDYCDIQGDVRVDPKSANVYHVVPSETYQINNISSPPPPVIKPYPRNGDEAAMGQIREWSVKMVPADHQDLPPCSSRRVHHHDDSSPALIFSLGAYFGNYFHAFTDVLVSLFVTARPFDRRLHLLVTNGHHLQITKFATMWQALSRYEVIDIDKVQPDGKALCFSRVLLGLKGRDGKELSINSSETRYTMKDFKRFLRSAYSLDKTVAIKLQTGDEIKTTRTTKSVPRLLIISRERTRTFTNTEEIVTMARELGYQVTVTELDSNVSRSARIANRADVMMGIHGAGLTNMVFLPEDAVVIQVVPFAVDWFATNYFGEPSKGMNVRYLEYKIEREESSLVKQYPPDDVVFTDPSSFRWEEFSPIYMLNQNVTLNVTRFGPVLLKALELLHQ
ncbi:unnamed protein product [Linum trigynum]|uniref:Glycosyltransferase 61 catalytic domain-containing protein n=1 Tax=Linum trigynum TaxID=586398 RepID=A0AAV2EZR2_9ROSI